MRGNMYDKARGIFIILFLILIMGALKTANFQANVTGAITYETQLSIMGLLLVLTVFAGMMAVYFRNRFGFT